MKGRDMETIDAKKNRIREGTKVKPGKMDFPIFIVVLALCAIGLVMVFSASYYSAADKMQDGLYFVRKQGLYLLVSLPIMLLFTRVDYHVMERFRLPILLVSIVLLVAVLLIGEEANGATRWLVLKGLSVQPSEVAKFGLIIYMSAFMSKKQHLMKSFLKGVVPMLCVMVVICGLVMLQPNMSMAVIIGMMGIIMLFAGGADYKHVALLILCGIGAFVLLAIIAPYRMARLASFTDPWQDPKGDGHQLIQSLYALGSGGIFGRGLNNSRQKLLYLTYGESDFVYAIVGEELGFIGAGIILLLYAFVVYRGMRVALRCKDRFGSMLAAGITNVFALQVLVNVGVVTGVMPTTGQALPFISAGGSSLLIFLSAMGVLLNISRHVNDM
ncbi:MAG: putative lipid II flippase FtsW [Clostridiales bacterium]|nr:putative lipid II flippase FtsW [Clostridiales bacterium]